MSIARIVFTMLLSGVGMFWPPTANAMEPLGPIAIEVAQTEPSATGVQLIILIDSSWRPPLNSETDVVLTITIERSSYWLLATPSGRPTFVAKTVASDISQSLGEYIYSTPIAYGFAESTLAAELRVNVRVDAGVYGVYESRDAFHFLRSSELSQTTYRLVTTKEFAVAINAMTKLTLPVSATTRGDEALEPAENACECSPN